MKNGSGVKFGVIFQVISQAPLKKDQVISTEMHFLVLLTTFKIDFRNPPRSIKKCQVSPQELLFWNLSLKNCPSGKFSGFGPEPFFSFLFQFF